ncbi:hypothetical protein lerEdw1_009765 [Lerista edwardsae]|nr:hypothetical protein lerEdw1_009765 [Lerista edwardsae]
MTLSQVDPKINITLKPQTPIAGADVTLIPGGYVEDIGICFWLRGGIGERHRIFTYFPAPHLNQEEGPAYTGRESAGRDCSLHIRNLTAEDTGNYTVFKNKLRGFDEHQEGNIYLVVLHTEDPRARDSLATPRPGRLSPNIIVAIIIGSVFGMAFLGGLLYFRLFCLSQV